MFNALFGVKWPTVSPDEIKKRARILVIDDSDFPYLILFKKDGYVIEKWNDVDDLPKLEAGYYDVILLDIQNVGRAHSQEQGLGILKHLHSVNPAQIVVAFSNADWSLKYHEFFLLADASLAKTEDYFQFKRTVDRLLQDRFSLQFYVDRICRLAGKNIQDDPKLRKLAEAAIRRGATAKLERYLKSISDNPDVISLSIKVAKVAVTLLSTLL